MQPLAGSLGTRWDQEGGRRMAESVGKSSALGNKGTGRAGQSRLLQAGLKRNDRGLPCSTPPPPTLSPLAAV